jgi:RNA polymerase sigma-70 factor (ECF subfamily)
MQNPGTVDELLVLQAQQGDRRALSILVKRWHPKLMRHAYNMVGNKAAAQDATQESWTAIMRNLSTLRDVAAFKVWMYRICTNKCRNWIRQQQRQRKLNEEFKIDLEMDLQLRPDSTRMDRIKLELSKMSLNQRQILAMFYLESLSMKEISACLNIPVGTVKSRLYHAREHLKKKYHEKYETTRD